MFKEDKPQTADVMQGDLCKHIDNKYSCQKESPIILIISFYGVY